MWGTNIAPNAKKSLKQDSPPWVQTASSQAKDLRQREDVPPTAEGGICADWEFWGLTTPHTEWINLKDSLRDDIPALSPKSEKGSLQKWQQDLLPETQSPSPPKAAPSSHWEQSARANGSKPKLKRGEKKCMRNNWVVRSTCNPGDLQSDACRSRMRFLLLLLFAHPFPCPGICCRVPKVSRALLLHAPCACFPDWKWQLCSTPCPQAGAELAAKRVHSQGTGRPHSAY